MVSLRFQRRKKFNDSQKMHMRTDLLSLWDNSSVQCKGNSKTILKNSDQWKSQEADMLNEVQESLGHAFRANR